MQQTQLIECEGNQVVVVSDATLTERNRIYLISVSLSLSDDKLLVPQLMLVWPGQDLREAELGLQ